MKKLTIVLLAVVTALGGATLAWAHHSHAMFDTSKEVTIKGTVTNFVFRNPHVFLYVDVKADSGEVQNWAVEMSNINNMERSGIYRSTFKVGDQVTVKINPLKDGRAGGNYTSVTNAEGKTFE
jgi:hypothetical protein